MDRLTKEQWLTHGLQTLAKDGFTALKADKLVKTLGVSRGSFYWHFKNLKAFHTELLAHWQVVTVATVIAELEQAEMSAVEKLYSLVQFATIGGKELEQSIRGWALSDSAVATFVQQVDEGRLSYLVQLLTEIGIDPASAELRARILYCGYLGHMMLTNPIDEATQKQMVQELVKTAVR